MLKPKKSPLLQSQYTAIITIRNRQTISNTNHCKVSHNEKINRTYSIHQSNLPENIHHKGINRNQTSIYTTKSNHNRLQELTKHRNNLCRAIDIQRGRNRILQQEIQTDKRNYEKQLTATNYEINQLTKQYNQYENEVEQLQQQITSLGL